VSITVTPEKAKGNCFLFANAELGSILSVRKYAACIPWLAVLRRSIAADLVQRRLEPRRVRRSPGKKESSLPDNHTCDPQK
jgi:hypothetical protein